MKIAISASGATLDSAFEPRFGRAPGFALFDSPSATPTYLDNTPQQNLSQGAGIQTAQLLADHGVSVLITGSIGPKAEQALAKSGIQIVTCAAATVAEALEQAHTAPPASEASSPDSSKEAGRGGPAGGGRGMGGGARGRGPGQGGRGMGGGGRGRGPGQGGRGMGGSGGQLR